MVTIDEAAVCPKCGVLGKQRGNTQRKLDDQGAPCDVCVYYCVNEGCNWYTTGWIVQSDLRGHVYERNQGERGQDKTFTKMSPDALARGQRQIEDIQRQDLRDENEGGS